MLDARAARLADRSANPPVKGILALVSSLKQRSLSDIMDAVWRQRTM